MRLEVVLAADARVGHHRRAGAGLDRGAAVAVAATAVGQGAVEGVVAAELVAHLVGDVVDGEEVALRLGQPGAAASLVGRRRPRRGRRRRRRRRRARCGRCRSWRRRRADRGRCGCGRRVVDVTRSSEVEPGSKQACAPHGPSGRFALAAVSRLRASVALTRRRLIGEVVVVDLVDPVDQGDLLGQHVGGAEVGGVRRVAGQGESVEAPRDHRTGGPVVGLLRLDGGPDRTGPRPRRGAGPAAAGQRRSS